MRDERRLFYVAMTRAEQQLVILALWKIKMEPWKFALPDRAGL